MHYLYVCCQMGTGNIQGHTLGSVFLTTVLYKIKLNVNCNFFKKCIIYLCKLGDDLPDSGDELVDHLFTQSLIHPGNLFSKVTIT